jgi:hypothetical protein
MAAGREIARQKSIQNKLNQSVVAARKVDMMEKGDKYTNSVDLIDRAFSG